MKKMMDGMAVLKIQKDMYWIKKTGLLMRNMIMKMKEDNYQ